MNVYWYISDTDYCVTSTLCVITFFSSPSDKMRTNTSPSQLLYALSPSLPPSSLSLSLSLPPSLPLSYPSLPLSLLFPPSDSPLWRRGPPSDDIRWLEIAAALKLPVMGACCEGGNHGNHGNHGRQPLNSWGGGIIKLWVQQVKGRPWRPKITCWYTSFFFVCPFVV